MVSYAWFIVHKVEDDEHAHGLAVLKERRQLGRGGDDLRGVRNHGLAEAVGHDHVVAVLACA